MSDLVLFLLERLPEDEWPQLDEHRVRRFAYEYCPEDRPGESRIGYLPGCAACTKTPSRHGEVGYGTSWIEDWPCRHLCSLALPFTADPEFNDWWRERLTLGPQVLG